MEDAPSERQRLCAAFRQAYEAAEISQQAISAATGIEQTTISKYARGAVRPPLDLLSKVDEMCGQRPGYILRLAGYVEPDDTRGALMTDPHLEPGMREALAKMYDGLRRGSPESGPGVGSGDGNALRASL